MNIRTRSCSLHAPMKPREMPLKANSLDEGRSLKWIINSVPSKRKNIAGAWLLPYKEISMNIGSMDRRIELITAVIGSKDLFTI
ncbi:MAG: hypothetical protein A2306_05865 [Omnitrophica WOR_2 bacterium RIFOXYB2_FULL_38_16]|nr:MAG: hypothetical protein A2243_02340 [Omnitrophica WOR_2 bacterium RIFOXYA2_FULL_38_17]OGX53119.1 MAG: hypothetical protein A2267_00795 [Omnitrophica WOR_2 bacterium RIFOXYA12_FULL_38_10]OGX56576.1 MAG: hypothetical protein A2447_07015 [Omnitrophica WOR_2 bacterium RIFOXYC2_FULL_38_12]OGX59795.1 MAG: hypothetical protein A2306_05865 [Omnitrophica WOR_2 bacterium RIFOXYB2_FULL_38_16]